MAFCLNRDQGMFVGSADSGGVVLAGVGLFITGLAHVGVWEHVGCGVGRVVNVGTGVGVCFGVWEHVGCGVGRVVNVGTGVGVCVWEYVGYGVGRVVNVGTGVGVCGWGHVGGLGHVGG